MIYIHFQYSMNVQMGIEAKSFNASERNEFAHDLCALIATKIRYPTEAERQLIAQKIIQTFPFLKDLPIGNDSNEEGTR